MLLKEVKKKSFKREDFKVGGYIKLPDGNLYLIIERFDELCIYYNGYTYLNYPDLIPIEAYYEVGD